MTVENFSHDVPVFIVRYFYVGQEVELQLLIQLLLKFKSCYLLADLHVGLFAIFAKIFYSSCNMQRRGLCMLQS
jgi:hypothetical protein